MLFYFLYGMVHSAPQSGPQVQNAANSRFPGRVIPAPGPETMAAWRAGLASIFNEPSNARPFAPGAYVRAKILPVPDAFDMYSYPLLRAPPSDAAAADDAAPWRYWTSALLRRQADTRANNTRANNKQANNMYDYIGNDDDNVPPWPLKNAKNAPNANYAANAAAATRLTRVWIADRRGFGQEDDYFIDGAEMTVFSFTDGSELRWDMRLPLSTARLLRSGRLEPLSPAHWAASAFGAPREFGFWGHEKRKFRARGSVRDVLEAVSAAFQAEMMPSVRRKFMDLCKDAGMRPREFAARWRRRLQWPGYLSVRPEFVFQGLQRPFSDAVVHRPAGYTVPVLDPRNPDDESFACDIPAGLCGARNTGFGGARYTAEAAYLETQQTAGRAPRNRSSFASRALGVAGAWRRHT